MAILRIKTEEEFEKEFGKNWINKQNWNIDMAYLYGIMLNPNQARDIQYRGSTFIAYSSIYQRYWTIEKRHVKSVSITTCLEAEFCQQPCPFIVFQEANKHHCDFFHTGQCQILYNFEIADALGYNVSKYQHKT